MEKVLPSDFTNGQEMLGDGDNLGQHEKDPYDNFMKRHLQHYGYYTGQNASYRENFRSLQEWRRNYDVRLSGHHNLSLVEEQLSRHGQLPSKILDNPSVFSTDGQLPDELLHRTTQLVFQYQAGRKIPKLREPRNLYALTKEAGPQQATRWPSHMQVVCPAIRFIEYDPPVPHPLYEPTGKEITPGVRGPSSGEMIYYNEPGRDLYFMRSRVAGCRLAMRSTTLTPREYSEDNLTLEFESRFESGNLLKVDKITDFDYELTLRTDLYTNKHTQWFFFRVRNMRPERTYRFTIINLMKPSSLYNQGMKPVYYSEVNAKKNKIGWIRVGSNIRYYRNNMCGRDGRSYYSLTWTCQFPFKDDCCYFAHCFPYTYSDLQEYLLQLANDPVRSRFCKQRVLTRTLAGNLVYILTITSPSRNPEISRAKKAVVITARVHPGETNASWMMKGFLDYLTGSSADAKLLRDSFIFKIIPMLNPDGVIVGNYRCSLAGRDLNRNYKSVLKDSFPSIWHAKMMIKRLSAEREVVVYCDLHGHSRKNNIFIYGCENKHNRQRRLQERVFPLMLAKNASQSFSYDSCKYKVQKSKEGTGRIVVWYMGIMNSYTMEATFGGTSLPGERQNTHLSTRDLEIMGHTFCDTLLDYCDPDSSKVEACMRELQDNLRRQIMKKFQIQNGDVSDVNIDDYISEMESDTSGSDSSCDDGLPVHLLAIAPKLQRKKKLRSKKDRGRALAPKPSGADSSKLPNTQSAKAANDRTKMRYTQGVSSGKRREERTAASTTIVTSTAVDNGHHDKSAKKYETRPCMPFSPNKASFVHFGHLGRQRSIPRKQSAIASVVSCRNLGANTGISVNAKLGDEASNNSKKSSPRRQFQAISRVGSLYERLIAENKVDIPRSLSFSHLYKAMPLSLQNKVSLNRQASMQSLLSDLSSPVYSPLGEPSRDSFCSDQYLPSLPAGGDSVGGSPAEAQEESKPSKLSSVAVGDLALVDSFPLITDTFLHSEAIPEKKTVTKKKKTFPQNPKYRSSLLCKPSTKKKPVTTKPKKKDSVPTLTPRLVKSSNVQQKGKPAKSSSSKLRCPSVPLNPWSCSSSFSDEFFRRNAF